MSEIQASSYDTVQCQTLRIPDTSKPRVVIIGGGFAGVHIARGLAKSPVQVVMIDRYNYHTFQPLLYQVATSGLEPDSIAAPLRKMLESQSNFHFRMATVTQIDTEEQRIIASIGSLRYDYLVLANGSKTNFYGNESIRQKSFPLKQLPQALDLRHHILSSLEQAILSSSIEEQDRLMSFVVVGGGPTGVEVAGALGELKLHVLPKDYPELDLRRMRIHLVEGTDSLLNGMSAASGEEAVKYLERFSVQVWLNTLVSDYNDDVVYLNNGTTIDAHTLIWGAGVMGNLIEGLNPASIFRNNRVKIDAYGKVEGYDNIFAAGDIAALVTEEYPQGHPMVAPVAIQQGQLLAKNLKKIVENKQELGAFVYKDKGSMATVGRNRAVVDLTDKIHFKGVFAWFVWLFVHLMAIVGFRSKLVVLTNWIWNYLTYDRAARLIIRPFVDVKNERRAEE
ncbi:MAG: NAD(P)/FAD-dependent oxidoreductase [Bernardetiaceae bacterium]|nr:NAD(P)/FAD-dependent oxidoreductase [Bernardetiaceae bacterium]